MVGAVDGSDTTRVVAADSNAVFVPPGYLLFVRQRTLVAQRFDVSTFSVRGEPLSVVDGVAVSGPILCAPVSASVAGPIVFRTGSAGGFRQFVWVDRAGKVLERVGEPQEAVLSPALSPDGRRVAFHHPTNGNIDLWLLELARGVTTRLTTDATGESHPTWSPDGGQLAFNTTRTGHSDVYVQSLADAVPHMLITSDLEKWPTDWSSDGRFILFSVNDPRTRRDIWPSRRQGIIGRSLSCRRRSTTTTGNCRPTANGSPTRPPNLVVQKRTSGRFRAAKRHRSRTVAAPAYGGATMDASYITFRWTVT